MSKIRFFKKIILILTVVILALFGLTFFVIRDIKNKNLNVYKLEKELSSQAKKSQYLISMKKTVENADNSIDQINSSVVGSDNDVEIIEKIENLAQQNGLEISIDSISVEDVPSINASGLTTLKIKAKTKGNWSSSYRFILGLESLEQKIRIERLVLASVVDEATTEGDKPLTNRWQTNFDIRLLKNK